MDLIVPATLRSLVTLALVTLPTLAQADEVALIVAERDPLLAHTVVALAPYMNGTHSYGTRPLHMLWHSTLTSVLVKTNLIVRNHSSMISFM